MIVVITDEAEGDFERIGDYIAQFNPVRSESFVDELLARCMTLSDMPLRFALMPRYEKYALRHFSYGNYAVYYRVEDERIEIVRILHGAQDHDAILFPDDEA